MTDALLVQGQHLAEGFFQPKSPSHAGAGPFSLIPAPDNLADQMQGAPSEWRPTSAPRDVLVPLDQPLQDPCFEFVDTRPLREQGTGMVAYLRGAEEALQQLTKSQESARRVRQFQEETRWLAENRHRFRGQWIALQGRKLLAAATTAKEVFSKVAHEEPLPLVVFIDKDDAPFAGW